MPSDIEILKQKKAKLDAEAALLRSESKTLAEMDINEMVWTSNHATVMSCVTLVFFLVVLAFASNLIKAGKDPEFVLKFFGTTLIICVATILIIAGFSDQQIAPVIGLLGTIAGYLLGSKSKKSEG